MKSIFFCLLLLFAFVSCKKSEDTITPTPVVPVVPVYSNAKELISFSFTKANNPGLISDVVATIDSAKHIITATFEPGTVITSLKANFVISAFASLKIGSTTQFSAITANDFTSQLTYLVTAQNGTTQVYTVIASIDNQNATTSNIVIKKEEYAPGPPVQTIAIQTIDFTYNSSNTLTGYKDNFGSYKFEYDANGMLKTQTVFDNSGNITNVLSYSMNSNKLPLSISGTLGQTLENYTYGPGGQVVKYTKSYFGVIKDTYEYTLDAKNRIKTAKYINSNDAAGTYTLTTFEYYDDVFDPNPLVKVAIRPDITAGLDPTTGKNYALKTSDYQKYDARGAIGLNTIHAYSYTTNANGFITSLPDGAGGALYKYTFK